MRPTHAPSHVDQKLDQILDSAERLVRRFGIRKTSMSEVAAGAGVSRATLYNYFQDKESLISALLDRAQRQFCRTAEAEVAKESSLLDKVTLAVLWSRQEAAAGLFLGISETEPETAAMMALSGPHIQSCMDFWPKHIQQAIDTGELCAALDANLTADWIQRTVLSLVIFPTTMVDVDNKQELRDYLKRHLMTGLSA